MRAPRHQLIDWLSAMSDVNRLRILRALEEAELSVGELSRVVQLPQSTVSRHLKILRDAHLVEKRSAGTASIFSVAGDLAPSARSLWTATRDEFNRGQSFEHEKARLRDVIASRNVDSRDFFGQLGSEWDRLRRDLFGNRFTADALLALIDPRWAIADLGCGTGEASELLAPHVDRIIAIDREPAMLDAARQRLRGRRNVQFREGDLVRPPLRKREIDAAVISLALHHLDEPGEAIASLLPCLRSDRGGGVILIIDMIAHDRAEFRHTMGHRHLGFSEKSVRAMARNAGFEPPRYTPLPQHDEARGPALFVATMRCA
jgi:ArsR family transcriptional regulator